MLEHLCRHLQTFFHFKTKISLQWTYRNVPWPDHERKLETTTYHNTNHNLSYPLTLKNNKRQNTRIKCHQTNNTSDFFKFPTHKTCWFSIPNSLQPSSASPIKYIRYTTKSTIPSNERQQHLPTSSSVHIFPSLTSEWILNSTHVHPLVS